VRKRFPVPKLLRVHRRLETLKVWWPAQKTLIRSTKKSQTPYPKIHFSSKIRILGQIGQKVEIGPGPGVPPRGLILVKKVIFRQISENSRKFPEILRLFAKKEGALACPDSVFSQRESRNWFGGGSFNQSLIRGPPVWWQPGAPRGGPGAPSHRVFREFREFREFRDFGISGFFHQFHLFRGILRRKCRSFQRNRWIFGTGTRFYTPPCPVFKRVE